jgi:hypothetical protein
LILTDHHQAEKDPHEDRYQGHEGKNRDERGEDPRKRSVHVDLSCRTTKLRPTIVEAIVFVGNVYFERTSTGKTKPSRSFERPRFASPSAAKRRGELEITLC